jgi:NAD-dependent deacetylase
MDNRNPVVLKSQPAEEMTTILDTEILRTAHLLSKAQRVVCLTGAGVSAESGVATFRDAQTGLWSKFDPRQLASQEGFVADPGLVWRWYMERLALVECAQPNPGHVALAQLEMRSSSFALFTQNVDNLHERAGSRNVLHLHGTISRFYCNGCLVEHLLQPRERTLALPPTCLYCGELVRPAVVWFGGLLPLDIFEQAQRAVQSCDLLLVVGASGVVYPAAELPFTAQRTGATVIEINPEQTPVSEIADVFLQGPSGQLLPQLVARLDNN